MSHVISFEFLNFLNFGDDDGGEKQLVGLRQASGRRQKLEQGPIFLITFAERGRGRDMAYWDVV